jgi:hypothetical protein
MCWWVCLPPRTLAVKLALALPAQKGEVDAVT